ncbi:MULTISPECIES: hypothetical protein [Rhodococcus]|uniref:hypothetical protein n=1 Tax=Rhodococcus TaxID=1827 RepID=UPI0012F63932|nr:MULTISPECIES: hypothetical protein [Rhodococcus]
MVLVVAIVAAAVVLLVVVGALGRRRRRWRNKGMVLAPEFRTRDYAPVDQAEPRYAQVSQDDWWESDFFSDRSLEPPRSEPVEAPEYPTRSWEAMPSERSEPVDLAKSAAREHARQRRQRAEERRRKLLLRGGIQYEDDANLEREQQLGAGGQGAVYGLVDNTGQVAKYWVVPLTRGAREFEELVHRRTDVGAAVSGHPIHLCWPASPVRRDGELIGYTMPRIGGQFYFEMTFGSVTKKHARELQHAIPRKQGAVPFPFEVDDQQRLELVYLVAVFLDGMHRNDIIYGDFSWMNFTFSLDPVELCVLDFDSSRVQGSLPFTRSLPLDSPNWEDPQWLGSVLVRMDSDRYKFALFAYRMLVARSLDAEIDPDRAAEWGRATGSTMLRGLWSRAMGVAGTRPPLSQWVAALEQVRHETPDLQPF